MNLFPQFNPIDRKVGETDMQILIRIVQTHHLQLESNGRAFDEETFDYSKIGDFVDEGLLNKICETMHAIAIKHGYPEAPNRTRSRAIRIGDRHCIK